MLLAAQSSWNQSLLGRGCLSQVPTLMGFTFSPMLRMFWLTPTRPALTFSG